MATFGYTYEYRSPGFPTSVMKSGDYRDVSDSIATLINTINSYRNQGKYDSAAILIRQNADILAKTSFGASLVNSLIEENRNAQLYALEVSQEIYTTIDEPASTSNNVIWIGGE